MFDLYNVLILIYLYCKSVEWNNVSPTHMTSFPDSLHVLENVLTSNVTHSYAVAGNIFCASCLTHSMSLKKYSTCIKKASINAYKHMQMI